MASDQWREKLEALLSEQVTDDEARELSPATSLRPAPEFDPDMSRVIHVTLQAVGSSAAGTRPPGLAPSSSGSSSTGPSGERPAHGVAPTVALSARRPRPGSAGAPDGAETRADSWTDEARSLPGPMSVPAGVPFAGDLTEDAVATRSALFTDQSGTMHSPPPVNPRAITRPDQAAYVPIEEIGRGGMGVVYRAEQSVLRRDIAVKTSRLDHDPVYSTKFISEALITAQLQHPNIVPVYDLTTTDDRRLALAMKLIGGLSWRDLLHPRTPEHRVRAAEADLEFHLDILIAVANAVAFAHSRHILHLDIKPANVLIGEFGEVLLVDWGMAMDFRDEPDPDAAAPHISRLSTPSGTPYYMAPELARGEGWRLGPWTDVYLLGAVLYEVVTGERPRKGNALVDVIYAAARGELPDFAEHDVPDQLRAVCLRAMRSDPRERYDSVSELLAALRDYRANRESILIAGQAEETLATCRRRARIASRSSRAASVVIPPDLSGGMTAEMAVTASVEVARPDGGDGDDLIDRNQLYSGFAEAVAGFRQALVLWPENPAAIEGEERARLAYARTAIRHGDYGLAEAQLKQLDVEQKSAANLLSTIHKAQRAKQREGRIARRLRLALGIAAVALITGLTMAYFLIDAQRRRAEDSEALALKRLADIQRLADVKRLIDVRREADALWPATPARVPQLRAWLADARELADRLPEHRAHLDALRAQGDRKGGDSVGFERLEEQWEHDTLVELVRGLEQLDGEQHAEMARRLAFADSIEERSITRRRAEWDEAIREIARSPAYGGLSLTPQLGLVPLGPDPRSGLWEFAHLQTGVVPERKGDGAIIPHDEMAIVFVLIPGGRFRMGAERPSPGREVGQGNVDPMARASEGPVHEVALSAFFLSKYEMTQAQWRRFTGSNPAAYQPGKLIGGNTHSALHPIEQVRWSEAMDVMERLGLTLPTEAQWEYAARAGTSTVFHTGDDPRSLQGALNIADRYCKEHDGPDSWHYEEWLIDGYVVHAPVGTYRPNRFGLHDTAGNVWEWCLDRYGALTLPVAPGTGARLAPDDAPRVFRGGGFRASVVHARVADRYSLYATEYRAYDLGLRPARALDGVTAP